MADDSNGSTGHNITRLIPGGKGDPIDALRDEIGAMREEISRRDDVLKMVLERLPGGGERRSGDLDRLEQRLDAAERDRDHVNERFHELRALIEPLVSKLAGASEGPEEMSRALREEMGANRSAIGLMRERFDEMDERLDRLAGVERDDTKLRQEVAALHDQVIADRAMLAEFNVSMTARIEALAQDGNAIEALRADGETTRAGLQNLEAHLADVSKATRRLAGENEALQAEIAALKDRGAEDRSMVAEMHIDLAGTRDLAGRAADAAGRLDDETQGIRAALDHLRDDVLARAKGAEGRLDAHDETLRDHGGRLDGLDEATRSHGGRLDAHDGAVQSHGERLDALDAAQSEQAPRLIDHARTLAGLGPRLETIEKAQQKQVQRFDAQARTQEAQGRRLDDQGGKLDAQHETLATHGETLQRHTESLERHETTLGEHGTAIAEGVQRAESLAGEAEEMRRAAEADRGLLRQLRTILQALRKDFGGLLGRHDTLEKRHEEQARATGERLEGHDSAIEGLHREINAGRDLSRQLRTQVQGVRKDMQGLSERYEATVARIEAQADALSRLAGEHGNDRQTGQALREVVEQVRADVEALSLRQDGFEGLKANQEAAIRHLDEHARTLERLEQEISADRDVDRQVQDVVDAVRKDVEGLSQRQGSLEERQTAQEALAERLDGHDAALARLDADLAADREADRKIHDVIAAVRQEVQDLTRRQGSTEERLVAQEALRRHLDEHTSALDALAADIAADRETAQRTRDTLEAARADIDRLRESDSGRGAEVEKARAAQEEAVRRLDEHADALERLRKETAADRSMARQIRTVVDAARKDLGGLSRRYASLEERQKAHDEVATRLDDHAKAVETLRREVGAERDLTRQLRTTLSAVRKEIQGLGEQSGGLEGQVGALAEDHKALHDRVERLRYRNRTLEKKTAALEEGAGRLDEHEASLQKLSARAEDIGKQAAAHDTSIKTLSAQARDIGARTEALGQRTKQLDQRAGADRETLRQVRALLTGMRNDIVALSERPATPASGASGSGAADGDGALAREMAFTRQTVQAQGDALMTLEKRLEDVAHALGSVGGAQEAAEQSLRGLQEKLEEDRSAVAGLHREILALREAVAEARATPGEDLGTVREEVAEVRKEVGTVKEKVVRFLLEQMRSGKGGDDQSS